MVIARLVKEFLVVTMHAHIVLRCGNLEVWDPSELTVDVALLTSERGPWRHASASDSILFIGVKRFLRSVRDKCLLLALFVEILLQKCLGKQESFKI